MKTEALRNISDKRSARRSVRINLLLCFAVPCLIMAAIYSILLVYPVGKNSVLVLDLNAQYIYYFEQLRNIILHGESIIYSFERALGGEFLGIFAYYLSSPFSLIVALFPKNMITEAMYVIILLKCGLCGLSCGWYLYKKQLGRGEIRLAASVMYALSSYAVVMQHNVMWTDNLIAFPLIMLGIDELISHGRYRLYVLSLVYAVMSNFYIGYMACIFVFVWFFVRYFTMSPEERNPCSVKYHFPKTLLRIGLWSAVAIAISAIIILPTYYSLTFGKLSFSDPDYTPEQLFDFADILTKAFFGCYDTVRPTGMPFYFCGTVATITAPLYFFSQRIPTRKKIGCAVMAAFFAASFNFSILDILWHGMQRPNWLNARFAYMATFFLVVMAVRYIDSADKTDARPIMLSSVLWCAALVILQKLGYDFMNDFIVVWGGIGVLCVYAAFLPTMIKYTGESDAADGRTRRYYRAFAGIVACEMLINGVAMTYQLHDDVSYSTRHSYRQMIDTYDTAVDILKSDAESKYGDLFYRAEKLVHRRKNDNFALGLRGMSNSTSTLNARAVELLHDFGYAAQSHWSMYIGATAVTDALFDIKYVIADETDDRPVMEYIHRLYDKVGSTDERLDIYENPYALSIAYAASPDVLEFDRLPDGESENEDRRYTDPFTYMNDLLTALTGHETEVWRACRVADMATYGVDPAFVEDHRGYEANGDLTPKLQFKLDIESDDLLYVYFPSDWPRECKMKVNDRDIGTFFESKTFAIRELGSFTPGEEVDFRLYLEEDDVYLGSGCQFFWYFDEAAFRAAIDELRSGVMEAHSAVDSRITGRINMREGMTTVFTTIPYDEGWHIRVDGESVPIVRTLNGTLLAFEASPGEHEIEMTYFSDAVKYGLICSAAGVLLFSGCLLIERQMKKRRATAPTEENLPSRDDGGACDNENLIEENKND